LNRIFATAAAITILSIGMSAVPAQAATPVPGRFCKVAEVGKKVTTAKYGMVICKKDGDRARWKTR
jgi:hypothetical protein